MLKAFDEFKNGGRVECDVVVAMRLVFWGWNQYHVCVWTSQRVTSCATPMATNVSRTVRCCPTPRSAWYVVVFRFSSLSYVHAHSPARALFIGVVLPQSVCGMQISNCKNSPASCVEHDVQAALVRLLKVCVGVGGRWGLLTCLHPDAPTQRLVVV